MRSFFRHSGRPNRRFALLLGCLLLLLAGGCANMSAPNIGIVGGSDGNRTLGH